MDANTYSIAFAPCARAASALVAFHADPGIFCATPRQGICVNRILMRRTPVVEQLMQDWLRWCGQSDVPGQSWRGQRERAGQTNTENIRKQKSCQQCRSASWFDTEVICPVPNPKPHPLCLFHTPEQAILAVLVRKLVLKKKLPAGWPFYSYAPCLHRHNLALPITSLRVIPTVTSYWNIFVTNSDILCAKIWRGREGEDNSDEI